MLSESEGLIPPRRTSAAAAAPPRAQTRHSRSCQFRPFTQGLGVRRSLDAPACLQSSRASWSQADRRPIRTDRQRCGENVCLGSQRAMLSVTASGRVRWPLPPASPRLKTKNRRFHSALLIGWYPPSHCSVLWVGKRRANHHDRAADGNRRFRPACFGRGTPSLSHASGVDTSAPHMTGIQRRSHKQLNCPGYKIPGHNESSWAADDTSRPANRTEVCFDRSPPVVKLVT